MPAYKLLYVLPGGKWPRAVLGQTCGKCLVMLGTGCSGS